MLFLVRSVLGFLAANVFILAVACIGGGYMWLAIKLISAWGPPDDIAGFAVAIFGIAAVLATYFTAKGLHTLISASLSRRFR